MGVGDVWNRALVYFGIVEEEQYWDDESFDAEEQLDRGYRERERPNVRRLHGGRRRGAEFEDWSDPDDVQPTAVLRGGGSSRRPPLEAVTSASVRVHLVVPRNFDDAKSIADKYKDAVPVILNLQGTDPDLSKRLIDFSSGLTYALNGGMQRIADKVFLLTPRNVEVSAEERARLIERGFFNQS
jgi:cell division inhibitor SepF